MNISWAVVVAVVLAAGCAWTAVPSVDGTLRRLGGVHTGVALVRRPVVLAAAAGIAVLLVVMWWSAVTRLTLLAAGALVVSLVCRQLVRMWRRRRARASRQRATIALCDGLAAELRAGLPVGLAVRRAGADNAEWAGVVKAAELGGDVADALRRCGDRPGAEGLRAAAAAWDVAARSGAALAVVLERVAAGLRADDEARTEVAASLSAPRATAKILAVLPVFGIVMGESMGAHPVRFLLHSGFGLMLLFGGVLLALAGIMWVERLAYNAEV